jgi:hypothetical protein
MFYGCVRAEFVQKASRLLRSRRIVVVRRKDDQSRILRRASWRIRHAEASGIP